MLSRFCGNVLRCACVCLSDVMIHARFVARARMFFYDCPAVFVIVSKLVFAKSVLNCYTYVRVFVKLYYTCTS